MKRSLALVGLIATLTSAGLARAEPYAIFVYETPADLALRADASSRGQDYWAAWARFAEVLTQAKAVRGGAPLQDPSQGRVFKAGGPTAGEAGTVSSASLALSGYLTIDAPSFEAAATLAAQAPSVHRGGASEVRAVYPAPTMSK